MDSHAGAFPFSHDGRDDLAGTLFAAMDRPRQGALFSVSLPARPETPVLDPLPADCVYTAQPASDDYCIGVGIAREWEASGPERMEQLAARLAGLSEDWRQCTPQGAVPDGRRAFVGYAFHPEDTSGPLPNTLLQVPRLIYRRSGATATLTFNANGEETSAHAVEACLEAADDLGRALVAARPRHPRPMHLDHRRRVGSWIRRVERALASIEAGDLEKVVLTRKIDLHLPRRPRIGPALAALPQDYSSCGQIVFARGAERFVSLSPERLLSVRDRVLIADALAGTAPRAPDPAADRGLALALLKDRKSRREHAVVVREIRRDLELLGVAAMAGPRPELLKLPSVQHLWTRVRGRLPADCSPLDVVAALHPTPAVGGTPRAAAMDWLERQGEAGRGWYTGGAGWISPAGDGTIWVLLRCARWAGRQAELFAGAGIVADSDPAWELGETGWKLAPMLEVFALA